MNNIFPTNKLKQSQIMTDIYNWFHKLQSKQSYIKAFSDFLKQKIGYDRHLRFVEDVAALHKITLWSEQKKTAKAIATKYFDSQSPSFLTELQPDIIVAITEKVQSIDQEYVSVDSIQVKEWFDEAHKLIMPILMDHFSLFLSSTEFTLNPSLYAFRVVANTMKKSSKLTESWFCIPKNLFQAVPNIEQNDFVYFADLIDEELDPLEQFSKWKLLELSDTFCCSKYTPSVQFTNYQYKSRSVKLFKTSMIIPYDIHAVLACYLHCHESELDHCIKQVELLDSPIRESQDKIIYRTVLKRLQFPKCQNERIQVVAQSMIHDAVNDRYVIIQKSAQHGILQSSLCKDKKVCYQYSGIILERFQQEKTILKEACWINYGTNSKQSSRKKKTTPVYLRQRKAMQKQLEVLLKQSTKLHVAENHSSLSHGLAKCYYENLKQKEVFDLEHRIMSDQDLQQRMNNIVASVNIARSK